MVAGDNWVRLAWVNDGVLQRIRANSGDRSNLAER